MTGQLAPGMVFAGFTIEKVIGEGGMGTVYIAAHPRLPRKVALKLLHGDLTRDEYIRSRFELEADHAARLDHPNIVTVHDRGREGDHLWIAMQYVIGTDAKFALEQNGPFEPELAVRIVTEIARALDYAHSAGVLHRDVKPANILLEQQSPHRPGRVLLADFGIAKALSESEHITKSGMLVASLHYAAPEQFQGGELDARADVYSLGCTLFHLLTGDRPYPGGSLAQLMHEHLHAPIPNPSRARPELGTAFDEVVATALAKNREHRYSSCGELAQAAQQALNSAAPTVVEPKPASPGPVTQVRRTETTSVAWPPPPPTRETEEQVVDPESTRDQSSDRRKRSRTFTIGAAVAVLAFTGVTGAWYLNSGRASDKSITNSVTTSTPAVTNNFAVTDTIPIGSVPIGIAINAETGFAYVVHGGEKSVWVIDIVTNTVTGTIPLSVYARGVAVDPGAGTAYIVADQDVAVINTATNTVTGTIPVGSDPMRIAASPSAKTAYVTNRLDGSVSVIDTATNTVTATIAVGNEPFAVAVDPATDTAYVTDWNSDSVSVLNTATNTVATTIPVGKDPSGIAFDPGTQTAYVTNSESNSVSVINTSDNTVTTTIPVGSGPFAVAVDFATHTAYVTNGGSDSVTMIDTTTNTITATIPVGNDPSTVAVDPATHTAYVTNYESNSISVITR